MIQDDCSLLTPGHRKREQTKKKKNYKPQNPKKHTKKEKKKKKKQKEKQKTSPLTPTFPETGPQNKNSRMDIKKEEGVGTAKGASREVEAKLSLFRASFA